MKVVLKVSRAGATFSQNAGDEIEVTAAEAKRLIEAGHAFAKKKTERATSKDKAEKAVQQ